MRTACEASQEKSTRGVGGPMDFDLDLLPGSENVVNYELYHDSASASLCTCCRTESPVETSALCQHAPGVYLKQQAACSGG